MAFIIQTVMTGKVSECRNAPSTMTSNSIITLFSDIGSTFLPAPPAYDDIIHQSYDSSVQQLTVS